VINISGHRLSTAEVEAALVMNSTCAECAVVGVPDELTGQAMVCFCIIKHVVVDESGIIAALRKQVRDHIGPFASPKRIIIVTDLPKTRLYRYIFLYM
jgi:acetyl-CoA synthetase